MTRKKKQLPIYEKIEIQDVAAEGKALTRIDDLVVFVPYVVPGDIVDLKVTRKKHHYAEAVAVKFHKYSQQRAVPFCEHFGVCGGCKWQCLSYEEQIRYKQKQVMDNLTRIGKVELPGCSPILGSKKTQEYRNKLDFACSNKQWLTEEQLRDGIPFEPGIGFHISGAFDKVLPIHKCWLMDNLNNEIRNWLYDYARTNNLTFYDLRAQQGFLRGIVLRNSISDEWMVTVQFGPTAHVEASKDAAEEEILSESLFDREEAMKLLESLHVKFPQITSLMYVYNPKCNDTFGDLEELLKEKQAKQVIGIEYVPEAIEDAKVNSAINNIDNTLFYAGDMKDILNREFIEKHGRPDVIITDPPRAGMHQDVIDTILFADPKRIVYVSCNPATQARDLQLLDASYCVTRIQPVDMFPHTQHVENVVLLEHR